MTRAELAQFIDHTVLKPDATADDIERLCVEARNHQFIAVCVNPVWVEFAHERLLGSMIKIASVVGFPLGASASRLKAAEAQRAVADGADEIDMVLQIGHLKSGNVDKVRHDIEAVVQASAGKQVKAIFECALLTDDEKARACDLSMEAGAAFVKTSTGFSAAGGATVADVHLMRQKVGDRLGVKAAGGIRSLAVANAMIAAGANRLGTSSSVAILNELSE